MSKPYLVALGTACFDEYYSADSWVSEGDKLLVHPMEKKAGGMVANAASVMAGYGNSVYLVDFMNGGASNQELKENLASFGLNTSHIVTDDRLPDAKCIIVLTPKERTIFVLDFPRPKRVLPPQTQALLENAAYIYTTMAEIRRFENYEALLDSWRGAGAKIVFDLESTTFEDSSDPESHSGVSLPLVRSFWSGFLHIPAKSHGATSPGKHIPHRLVIRLE